jgi:hypothetical protein
MQLSDAAQATLSEILDACDGNYSILCAEYDNQGLCLECGELADSVEPDATGYTCGACGAHSVTGLENAILFAS